MQESLKPPQAKAGWYESKGPEFNSEMHTYMKSLEGNRKWKDSDEAHYQGMLKKTGLDLTQRVTDVNNPRKQFSKKY